MRGIFNERALIISGLRFQIKPEGIPGPVCLYKLLRAIESDRKMGIPVYSIQFPHIPVFYHHDSLGKAGLCVIPEEGQREYIKECAVRSLIPQIE